MGSTAAPSNTGGGYTGVRAALQYSTIQVVVIQVSGQYCSIVQSNTGSCHTGMRPVLKFSSKGIYTGIWSALRYSTTQVMATQVADQHCSIVQCMTLHRTGPSMHLVVMEDEVSVDVIAGYRVGPQLLHKEHLVGELWWSTCNTLLLGNVHVHH